MTNIIHKARRIFNTLQPSFMWWLNKPTESYENDGRRRKGLIWSAKAYYLLSHLSVMMVLLLWFQYPVLSWTGELAFIHDFTAEVYWSVCSAQSQPNASNFFSKATKELFRVKRWNILGWKNRSPCDWAAFQLLKTRLKTRWSRRYLQWSLITHHRGSYRVSADTNRLKACL